MLTAGIPAGRDVAPLASPHIHLGERHRPYNSTPPTSGPHWADTVGTGVYREELPEEIQVHVLEHGHILLQYAPQTPPGEVRELERIGRRHLRDVVVAPYSKLAPTPAVARRSRSRRGRGSRAWLASTRMRSRGSSVRLADATTTAIGAAAGRTKMAEARTNQSEWSK